MILMCQRCHTLWLIVCVSLLSFNRAHAQDAGVFQDCGTAVNISISCTWRTRQAVPGAVIIRGSEPEQGGLKPPVLLAADAGQAASQPAVQGGAQDWLIVRCITPADMQVAYWPVGGGIKPSIAFHQLGKLVLQVSR